MLQGTNKRVNNIFLKWVQPKYFDSTSFQEAIWILRTKTLCNPSCENENNKTLKLTKQNFNKKIIKDFVSPVIISGANMMNMLDTTDLITTVEEINKNNGKLDFNQEEEVENFYV